MLILKIFLAPALIGLATWVGRRWGPAAGGWFAALPLTSGPVVLVLALERGPRFARDASVGVLLALLSLASFALAYSWSSQRSRWPLSSVMGCTAYLTCTWLLQDIVLSPSWAFLLACAALVTAIYAIPTSVEARQLSSVPLWWDIPFRMALAAILVVGLTLVARALGPHLSGLLTPFPIAATILAACAQYFEGPAAARQLLRGLLIGLFSFAVFFLVLSLLITRGEIGSAFITACAAALGFHAGAWRHLRGPLRASEPGRSE
jgi:hypothetical protein